MSSGKVKGSVKRVIQDAKSNPKRHCLYEVGLKLASGSMRETYHIIAKDAVHAIAKGYTKFEQDAKEYDNTDEMVLMHLNLLDEDVVR